MVRVLPGAPRPCGPGRVGSNLNLHLPVRHGSCGCRLYSIRKWLLLRSEGSSGCGGVSRPAAAVLHVPSQPLCASLSLRQAASCSGCSRAAVSCSVAAAPLPPRAPRCLQPHRITGNSVWLSLPGCVVGCGDGRVCSFSARVCPWLRLTACLRSPAFEADGSMQPPRVSRPRLWPSCYVCLLCHSCLIGESAAARNVCGCTMSCTAYICSATAGCRSAEDPQRCGVRCS